MEKKKKKVQENWGIQSSTFFSPPLFLYSSLCHQRRGGIGVPPCCGKDCLSSLLRTLPLAGLQCVLMLHH